MAADPVQAAFQTLTMLGLEGFYRYYSLYRGTVTRVDDPLKRGRIQAHIPRSKQDVPLDVWIEPAFMGAGSSRGFFWPPELKDSVWVAFDNGDVSRPLLYFGGWLGAFGGAEDLPGEFAYTPSGNTAFPEKRGFLTRMGQGLVFCDAAGQEQVTLVWHQPDAGDKAKTDRSVSANRGSGKTSKVTLKADGSVELTNAVGAKFLLDAANNKVQVTDPHGNEHTMDAEGITYKTKKFTVEAPTIDLKAKTALNLGDGADQPVMRGRDVLAYMQGHVHPFAAPVTAGVAVIGATAGVTLPPQPSPLPTLLSLIVKTK
jgi:phage baseplate assembly protein gpV